MDTKAVPYVATAVSIIARFVFMYLLYTKKSTNNFSLLFCMLSICSSGMWEYYSVQTMDLPLTVRSSSEILLLSISAAYIIRNKILEKRDVIDDLNI